MLKKELSHLSGRQVVLKVSYRKSSPTVKVKVVFFFFKCQVNETLDGGFHYVLKTNSISNGKSQ